MNIFIEAPRKEELNVKGFTNRIRLNEGISKETLLKAGFTNQLKSSLYLMKNIDKETSFNLTICSETFQIQGIDILDENILQPYDYQLEIAKGQPSEKAINVFRKVNNILDELQRQNIITGFKERMYI